jgi:heme/copper-type cytochrome/quinol oxidase subunit 2
MIKQYKNFIVLIVLLLGNPLLLVLVEVPTQTENEHKEFEIKLSQYRFNPDQIRVNRGDTVILSLQSKDVLHGFHIESYNISLEVFVQAKQFVTFVADKEGKFKISCNVLCGNYHPYMIGELLVGTNKAFFIAVYYLFIMFIFFQLQVFNHYTQMTKKLKLPVINNNGE